MQRGLDGGESSLGMALFEETAELPKEYSAVE
jgi:hypothetical protein